MDTHTDVMPMIDMHTHIHPQGPDLNSRYIDDLVATGRANGIQKVVLGLNARQPLHRPPTYSEEHDELVAAAFERHPDFIIPALGGFDPADPTAVGYVSEQLATGRYKMLGELDLRNQGKETVIPANCDTLMQIYALAAGFDIPVMIHFNPDYMINVAEGEAELHAALAGSPDTTFIMAHGCGVSAASFMAKYPNLYCEHFEVVPIAADLDFTRVVLGTDAQVVLDEMDGAPERYELLIETIRSSIAPWDEADQERAAIATPSLLLGL